MEVITVGIEALLNWQSWLGIILGLLMGAVIGAIPGLGPNTALAIAIPLCYGMDPLFTLPFMMAIYKSCTFGGSISSITINTPGTAANVATCWGGYPMSKGGRTGRALMLSLYSSTFGDMFSNLVLIFLCIPLASFALKFGAAEFTGIYVFSLLITATLAGGGSAVKGFLSTLLGLLFACVGMDPVIGLPRFDVFGLGKFDKIDTVAFLLGAFALTEVFEQTVHVKHKEDRFRKMTEKEKKADKEEDARAFLIARESIKNANKDLTWRELITKYWHVLIQGSVVGAVIGIIPGIGSNVGTLFSYALTKSLSRRPEKFGTGIEEGIISPEASNNAVCGANILPLVTLGIPGNPIAALFGAAMLMNGIIVGPSVFEKSGDTLYGLFICMVVATIGMFLVGKYVFVRLSGYITVVPLKLLYPAILILSLAGTYSVNRRMSDVGVMVFVAVISCLMRRWGISVAPMVISFVLGRSIESSMRQALIISGGRAGYFFSSPIGNVFYALSIVVLLMPIIRSALSKRSETMRILKEHDEVE